LRKNRFSFNLWVAITPNNSYSEVDLVPAYDFGSFKLTVFDYYNPVPKELNQYLNFGRAKSRHSLELTLDNYSVEKPGLKWMIGMFLAGDRNAENGNPLYSTYVELKYPFAVWHIQAEPIVGMTPFRGYYADWFALINAGISVRKDLNLKLPVKIPLRFSWLTNPYSGKNFIVFGAGIAF
jgi:hypothetical protein